MKGRSKTGYYRLNTMRTISRFWDWWFDYGCGPFPAEVFMWLVHMSEAKNKDKAGKQEPIETTLTQLARKCNLNWRTVRECLDCLEKFQFIKTSVQNKKTYITICGLMQYVSASGKRERKVAEKCDEVQLQNSYTSDGQSTSNSDIKHPEDETQRADKTVSETIATTKETKETKESSPAPPPKKEKKEKKESACVRFSQNAAPTGISSFVSVGIDERKRKFWSDVCRYVEKYGRAMCEAFFLYWSEPSQDGQRMRWELQRTWSVGGRLAMWNRKEARMGQSGVRSARLTPEAARLEESRRDAERAEREAAVDRMYSESVPAWAYRKIVSEGLYKNGMSAKDVLGTCKQLAVLNKLSQEELQLLGQWEKRHKSV